jgi:hypothetical protein
MCTQSNTVTLLNVRLKSWKKDKELCEIKRKVREIATNPNPTRYASMKYELIGLNHVISDILFCFSLLIKKQKQ